MSDADERLIVMLEARITEFEKRMQQAEKRGARTYNQLQRGAKSAAAQMENDLVTATGRINQALANGATAVGGFAKAFVGGLAGGLVMGAIGSLNAGLAETIRSLAEVGDQAKRAGVNVEDFQQLAYVARQNRIDVDALTDGLKEMSLRVDEFVSTGAGPAAEALGRLGLSADELRDKIKDPSALLLEMVGRMEALDKAAQIRIADEVFGGTGGERFVELLALGEGGIRAQMDRATELGVVLDEEVIAKAAELDRKYSELGDRLHAVWARMAVDAGYYFGLIERERAKLELDADKTAQVAGQDVVDYLAGLPEAGQDALIVIEELAEEYSGLTASAEDLVLQLSDASSAMRGLGDEATASAFTDLASRLSGAVSEFEAGTITGEEFAGKLTDIAAEADKTVSALDDLDRARLSGITGAVSDLLSWLQQLPAAVAAARAAATDEYGMDTGTPLTVDQIELAPGEGAIPTSPRPVPAPPMIHESGASSGSGRSSSRGGGRGQSPRLERLIEDLQTERALTESWYQESLELLNGATDTQLEALGGRHEAIERLEQEHMDRLREIRDMGEGSMLSNTETFFGAMAELTAAGGGKMVKAARVFAAAEALINTYRAQAKVLADPTLGFFGSMAAYASIGAAGLRVVSAIKGGGGGSSGGGVSSASASYSSRSSGSDAAEPLRVMLEPIDPDALYSGATIRRFVDAAMQELADRGMGGRGMTFGGWQS